MVLRSTPKARMVRPAAPDGLTARVRAGEQIDLSAATPGDNVTVRLTEALAISVEALSQEPGALRGSGRSAAGF